MSKAKGEDIPVKFQGMALASDQPAKVAEELNNAVLHEQVAQLEEQKMKLLMSLKEYKEKYEQQKSDQADIYYYLNKKLDENYETICGLEEQILTEQTDRENNEKLLEKSIEDLKARAASDKLKYTTRIHELEEKLESFREFSENKDELDRNLERLMSTLEFERQQFRAMSEEAERRAIQDRERVRLECDQQFEAFKQNVQIESFKKLSTKTKKTFERNKLIKAELSHQSKQAEHVLLYNQKILDRDRELRQELELTKSTQEEMVNRLALYQRLIKQLNERIATEEKQNRSDKEDLNNRIEEKESEITSLRSRLQELKDKVNADHMQQDKLMTFLLFKYRNLTRYNNFESTNLEQSITEQSVMSHSLQNMTPDHIDKFDNLMCELVRLVLQKYPERFNVLSKGTEVKSNSYVNETNSLPPIRQTNYAVSHVDLSSHSVPTVTGIHSWDSARFSAQTKWWNNTQKINNNNSIDSNNKSVEIGGKMEDSVLSSSIEMKANTVSIGVQTEGKIATIPVNAAQLFGEIIERSSTAQDAASYYQKTILAKVPSKKRVKSTIKHDNMNDSLTENSSIAGRKLNHPAPVAQIYDPMIAAKPSGAPRHARKRRSVKQNESSNTSKYFVDGEHSLDGSSILTTDDFSLTGRSIGNASKKDWKHSDLSNDKINQLLQSTIESVSANNAADPSDDEVSYVTLTPRFKS